MIPHPARLSALTLLILSVAPIAAQESATLGSPAAAHRQREIGAAWQRFLAEHAPSHTTGTWHVEWNPATGTPAAIYGPGLARHSGYVRDRETAETIARQLVADHAALLGQGASTFKLRTYAKVRQTHVLVFDQTFRGVPVIRGRADVRLHDSGVVSLFGSECFAIAADHVTAPTFAATTAIAVARDHASLDAGVPVAPARLVLWADRSTNQLCSPRLAWEVDLQATDAAGLSYVDAHTGELFEFQTTRHHLVADNTLVEAHHRTPVPAPAHRASPTPEAAGMLPVTGTVMGYVAGGFGPGVAAVNRPLAGVRIAIQGGGTALTDTAGWFSIPHPGTAPVTVDVRFGAGEHIGTMNSGQGVPMLTTATMTPGIPGSIQVYSAAATEFELAQSSAFYYTDRVARFVRQPHILGNHPNLLPLQNLAVSVNDALTFCNAYYVPGQPPGVRFAPAVGGCPNFAFPTVIEHEWGHGLDYAFGGANYDKLAEGWADLIANYSTGQPIIGENYNGPGQHVRDARNNQQYPNGIGHEGGLVWMGGAWKLRQRLIAKHGAVVGQQLAETIVLGSIAANALSIPAAVREIYLLDDNDANLNNGTPNCAELFASFTTDHNIPSPLTTCSTNPGVVSAFGAGCIGTATTPPICQSQNDSNTGIGLAPPISPNVRVAYGVVASQPMAIDRVDLFTRSRSGSGGLLSIHRDAGGRPSLSATATVHLAAPTTTGWVSATLATPIPVVAGERIFLVHDSGAFDSALLAGGAPSASPTLMDFGGGAWLPLFGGPDHAVWRLGCPVPGPFVAPYLATADLPEIGRTFTLDVSQTTPNTNGLMILGESNTASYARPLPWDLSPLGAPGCSLLVSAETVTPLVSDPSGNATVAVAIPQSNAIVGLVVYSQVAMWDGGANPLGVAMSGALRVRVGTP